jgi:hypothetical protein
MIADSGGPMFRGFVEPTLSTLLKLLLSQQTTSLEVNTLNLKLSLKLCFWASEFDHHSASTITYLSNANSVMALYPCR